MSNVTQTMEIPKQFNSKKFGKNKIERSISLIDYWLGKFLKKIDLKSTLVIITSDHGDYISISNKRDSDYIPEFAKTTNIAKSILPKFLWPIAKKIVKKTRTKIQEKRFKNATKNLTELEKRSLRTRAGEYLFDNLVHTPLLFCGNHTVHGVIKDQVRSVDIFSTILDLIGLPQMDEEIDGESLMPLIKNEIKKPNPIYLETASVIKDEALGKTIGIRTVEYKYFRSRKSVRERVHLYNLKNDPFEENNLAKINLEMIKKMELVLSNLFLKSNVSANQEINEKESKIIEDELKKLGYI